MDKISNYRYIAKFFSEIPELRINYDYQDNSVIKELSKINLKDCFQSMVHPCISYPVSKSYTEYSSFGVFELYHLKRNLLISPRSKQQIAYNIISPNLTEALCTPKHSTPILLDNNPMTNTPNLIASSFGMKYLLEFQQKIYAQNKKLFTISNVKITKESFDDILKNISCKSVFEHEEKDSTVYELIDDNYYISLKVDKSQSLSYSIDFALLNADYRDLVESKIVKPLKTPSIKWIDGVDQYGELTSKIIKNFDCPIFYSSAYPFLQGRLLEDFVENYLNSQSPILLLYGPPGTAKSTLLKHILTYSKESSLITFNKDIASMDALFSHFYDSPERFLIIEDADTYINSRSKDGNDVMKKLLNITDGLTANKHKKVIFTTNLNNLNDVDEALVRPGRCYGTFHLDYLTKDQSIHYLTDIKREDIIPQLKDKNSIAEIYGMMYEKEQSFVPSAQPIGFGFNK